MITTILLQTKSILAREVKSCDCASAVYMSAVCASCQGKEAQVSKIDTLLSKIDKLKSGVASL